jgi:putative flippase GtrA
MMYEVSFGFWSERNFMQVPPDKVTETESKAFRAAWIGRISSHIPREQFGRYLLVGVLNTLFGYGAYAALTAALAPFVSHSYIPASIIAAPLNITVSYLGYKWFVFKTQGNYLHEWTRCLIVYGSAMILGIVLLPPVVFLVRLVTGLDRPAPYIAGALLMGFNVIYSFLVHKNFSFRSRE